MLDLLKKHDQLEAICKKYVEIYPNKSMFHDYLGSYYKKRGRLKEAILEYKKAIELNPEILSYRLDLIVLLYKNKQYEEVIRYCMEVFTIKQPGPLERLKSVFFDTLYWYLAASYQCLGHYEESIEFYEKLKSFKRYKNDPKTYECLGYCFYKLNQNQKAIEAYKQALKLGSDNREVVAMIDELQTN